MAQADGSVVIKTELDNGGLEKGFRNLKSKLASLTNTGKSLVGSFKNIGSSATKSFKKASKGADSFGSSLKKLGGIIATALATQKIAAFSKECINLGSDLAEVQNVVDVAFTSMSDKIDAFSKNAIKSAGLSELVAKEYSGTFGIMAKSFGFAEDQAFNMSAALTQLTGDVASFYNLDSEEAFNKMKSVFTGETESLKSLGVVMTQTALDQYALQKGLKKTTSQMTEQEKVALRYSFVMDKLSGASGDFVRTQKGWANQTRILKLQFESLKAEIGQGLINALTPVVQLMNLLIEKLLVFAGAFKSFTALLFGNQDTSEGAGISQAASDTADLASNTEDVAEATEEAEKAAKSYLSGLDEINKFVEDDQDLDLGIDEGSISIPEFDIGEVKADTSNLEGKIDALAEKMKSIFDVFVEAWNKKGEYVKDRFLYMVDEWKQALKEVGKTLYEIWTDGTGQAFIESVLFSFGSLLDLVGAIGEAFKNAWNTGSGEKWIRSIFSLLTDVLNLIGKIGSTFAEVFRSEYGTAFIQSLLDKWTSLLNLIDVIASALSEAWDESGLEFAQSLIYFFTQCNREIEAIRNSIATAFSNDNRGVKFFNDVLQAATNVLNLIGDIKRDIAKAWESPAGIEFFEHIIGIVDGLISSVGNLAQSFDRAWNKAGIGKKILQDILNIDNSILGPLENIASATAEWAANLDFYPLLQSIDVLLKSIEPLTRNVFEGLEWAWKNVLLPLGSFVIEDVLPRFFNALAAALGLVNAVIEVLKPLFMWFWDNVIVPLAEFTGFAICGALDLLCEGLNNLTSWINGDGEAVNGFLSRFSAGWDRVSNAVTSFWEEHISPVLENLRTIFVGVWNDHVIPVLEKIGPLFASIGDFLVALWNNVLAPFIEWLLETFGPIIEAVWNSVGDIIGTVLGVIFDLIGNLIDIFQGVLDFLTGVFTGDWEKAWSGLQQIFAGIWNGLGGIVQGAVDIVVSIARGLWNTIGGIFEGIGNSISKVWGSIKETTSKIWQGIASTLGGIWDGIKRNVTQVWSNIKSSIGSAWTWLKDQTKKVWDGIVNIIKAPINLVIGVLNSFLKGIETLVNSVAKALNNLSFELPDWMGGAKIGFNFGTWSAPQIPKLATGAVIPPNNEFLAVLGDQKSGYNIETPEKLLRTIVAEESAIALMSASFSGSPLAGLSNSMNSALSSITNSNLNAQKEWDKIAQNLIKMWDNLGTYCKKVFKGIGDYINGIWQSVNSYTGSAWGNIANTVRAGMQNIANMMSSSNSFATLLTNVWNQCVTATNNGWINIHNKIVERLNAISNMITNWLNGVSRAMSSVASYSSSGSSSSTRRTLSLDSGLAIPFNSIVMDKVPMLAQGAVIPANAPFLAVLGDQRNGNNIEAPEGLIRKILREELQNQNNGNGIQGDIYLTVQAGNKKLLETVIEQAKLQQIATGKNPFVVL